MNHTLEAITLEIKNGKADWSNVSIGGLHRARQLIVRTVTFDCDEPNRDRAFVLRCRTIDAPLAIVRHGCILASNAEATVYRGRASQLHWHFELDEQRPGRGSGTVDKITCKITLLLEAVWSPPHTSSQYR